MRCPFCQEDNDKVTDSRAGEDGFVIRRRRMCLNCSKRFTTFERVAELDLRVVKKDGSRESFQPEKIRKGIERACWKRPIPTEQVERILMEVVQQIYLHESIHDFVQEVKPILDRNQIETRKKDTKQP